MTYRYRLSLTSLLLIAFCVSGATCNEIHTRNGTWYRVRKGDSLSRIARHYRSSVQSIAEHNNIMKPSELRIGQRLYIPAHSVYTYAQVSPPIRQVLPAKPKTDIRPTPSKPNAVPTSNAQGHQIRIYSDHFIWPVQGPLSSKFGIRKGRRHDGVDIKAAGGTPIRAAGNGEVAFAARLRGYGNLVLVKHKDDFFTVYAHNSRNLVKKGQKVKQGEIIARVGSTGRATGPHLHFEVRKGSQARNPLFFLPQGKTQVAKK